MNYAQAVKKYSRLLLLINLYLFSSIPCIAGDTGSQNEQTKKTEKTYNKYRIGGIAAAVSLIGYLGWYRWRFADDLDYQLTLIGKLLSGSSINDMGPAVRDAAAKGYINTLRMLISQKAPVDEKNANGETALFIAVKYGQMQSVKLLVGAGATNNGMTLFDAAAQLKDSKQKKEVIQYLIDKGLTVDRHVPQSDDLIFQGRVQKALSQGHDAGPFLCHAASKGYKHTLKMLLLTSVAIDTKNEHGESPLYMAVKGGHMPAIKLLVDEKANIRATTDNGVTLFGAATNIKDTKKRQAIVRYLINNGLVIDRYVKQSNVFLYPIIDRYSREANVLLHQAILDKAVELVDFLIKKGVDVNLSYENYTPLVTAMVCHAKEKGCEHRKKILQLLVQTKRCNINAFIPLGFSPLHLAIEYDFDDHIIELFIKHGANVNERTRLKGLSCTQNRNPLFFALGKQRSGLIETLLAAGANSRTYIETDNGDFTPYEIVDRFGPEESITLLEECTALELMTEQFQFEQEANLQQRAERERIKNANAVWFMQHAPGDSAFPSACLLSKIKTKYCAISEPREHIQYQSIKSI